MEPKSRHPLGFTLMELMIVVSVLAIMASIAIPKFANSIQRAKEGALKGNLGALRSALSIYYADNSGNYPTCVLDPTSIVLDISLYPKYIGEIPAVKSGLHPPVANVYCDAAMIPGSIHDGQGWYYDGTLPQDSQTGGVWVACDHTDTIGNFWTGY